MISRRPTALPPKGLAPDVHDNLLMMDTTRAFNPEAIWRWRSCLSQAVWTRTKRRLLHASLLPHGIAMALHACCSLLSALTSPPSVMPIKHPRRWLGTMAILADHLCNSNGVHYLRCTGPSLERRLLWNDTSVLEQEEVMLDEMHAQWLGSGGMRACTGGAGAAGCVRWRAADGLAAVHYGLRDAWRSCLSVPTNPHRSPPIQSCVLQPVGNF
jgi:hypothetical protein